LSCYAELAVATRRVGDIVKGVYPSKTNNCLGQIKSST